jgi:hypothetical protein
LSEVIIEMGKNYDRDGGRRGLLERKKYWMKIGDSRR